MPTVTNYDVLGAVPWGQGRPGTDRDRSDARGGINMLLFDNNASGPPGHCERPPPPAPEHGYAAAASFVSANGYYGYHPQHQDCSMDTSENNPLPGEALGPFGAFGQPLGAVGQPPMPLGPLGLPGQHAWHAAAAAAQSRKRRPGALTDPDGNDRDAKRSKCVSDPLPLGLELAQENHPGKYADRCRPCRYWL